MAYPASVHFSTAAARDKIRQITLSAAYAAHPGGSPPTNNTENPRAVPDQPTPTRTTEHLTIELSHLT
jgi:hypothetical protein